MMKNETSLQRIVLWAITLLVGVALYFAIAPHPQLRRQIEEGRMEIAQKDFDRYFVYVSADEARRLFAEARARGEFRFLFPQVDLSGAEHLTVESYEKESASGEKVTLLGIRGLQPDALVYSNFEGTVSAAAVEYANGDRDPLIIFTGRSGDARTEFYVPYLPGANDVPPELEGAVHVTFGATLTGIPDSRYLRGPAFPAQWQLAMIVARAGEAGGAIDGGALKNVLLKNGKIVMVRR